MSPRWPVALVILEVCLCTLMGAFWVQVLAKRFLAGDLWEPPLCSISDWFWSCTDTNAPPGHHSAPGEGHAHCPAPACHHDYMISHIRGHSSLKLTDVSLVYAALSSENGGAHLVKSAAEPPLKDTVGIQWCSAPSPPPAYPESTEEAHARYTAALEAIADRHAGVNVLVMTHGEAVRRSVARLVRTSHLL